MARRPGSPPGRPRGTTRREHISPHRLYSGCRNRRPTRRILAAILLSTAGLVAVLALGQGLAPLSGNIAAGRYVQDGTAVGDVISVDGVEGTVEELGYASITLRSENGNLYRIPNRTLLENIVRKRA